MNKHATKPIELVDSHYPSIKEIKGLSFSLTIVVQANDLSFKDEFDRLDDAARIVKTWNAHDESVAALKQAKAALAHDAPESCWATGPLTGNYIQDLIVCPGCSAIARIDAALAKAGAA